MYSIGSIHCSASRPMCEGIYSEGEAEAAGLRHGSFKFKEKVASEAREDLLASLLPIQELQSGTVRSSFRKAAVATGLLTSNMPTDMAI